MNREPPLLGKCMRSTDRPSNSTPGGASAACPVPSPLEQPTLKVTLMGYDGVVIKLPTHTI